VPLILHEFLRMIPSSTAVAMIECTRPAVMSADQLREWGEAVDAVTREHVRRARRQPSQHRRPVRLLIPGFPHEFAPERAN